MQQQRHRWLKLCIRLLLPVFALAGFGSISSLVLPGIAFEKELVRTESPSGFYRASVIQISGLGACGYGGTAVRVQRHRSIFKTGDDTPFCLSGRGVVRLKWIDNNTLAITCSGCEQYGIVKEDWENLHYSFGPDQP